MKIFHSLLGFLLVASSMVLAISDISSWLTPGMPKLESSAAGVSITRQFGSQVELEAAGYTLHDMVFRGYIGPHYIEHNGTIEEVVAQVVKEHPEFDPEAYINMKIKEENEKNTAHVAAANSTGSAIDTRNANFNGYCCPVPGQWFFNALGLDTVKNYWFLRSGGFGNFIELPAGPGGCSRIACLGYSAVMACNDNPGPLVISATYLSDLLEDVGNNCSNSDYDERNIRTCGQVFGAYKVNVIITGWAPHC